MYKLSFTMLLLAALSTPFCAVAGMREKTLSDVMHEIMQTKDAAWLKANLGEPTEVDTQYPGYLVWRWKTQYKIKSQVMPCMQIFALDAKTQRLVGWQTDCNREKGSRKVYGEIDENTPIPGPVVPATIAETQRLKRIKAEEEALKNRTRKGSFADWLSTFVGTSEEEIVSQHPRLVSSEILSNGKLIKSYARDRNYDYDYVDCRYSFSFLKGKVVGYSVGNCGVSGPVRFTTRVPYNLPVAPGSAL